MRKIYRYSILIDDKDHVFELCGEVRHVATGVLIDEVDFYAEHEGGDTVPRAFRVVGTGHLIPDGYAYRGTAGRQGGLVWHLYENVTR